MTLDLSAEETEALARLLRNAIQDDRFPLSPRVKTWQAILDKIEPPPPRQPLPPRSITSRRGRAAAAGGRGGYATWVIKAADDCWRSAFAFLAAESVSSMCFG